MERKCYMDDPGYTAEELLKIINRMFIHDTFYGDVFLTLPVSFIGLIEEIHQTIEHISTSNIYGVPVMIVSDYDTGGIEQVLRKSRRGKELLLIYGLPESEATDGK